MAESASPKEKLDLSLEKEFTDIVEQAGLETGVLVEEVEEGTQHKYRVEDTTGLKDRLAALHAIPQAPVEQIDSYFLYPGQKPDFLTETLCWREERPLVDYSGTDLPDLKATGQLIYKTNPHRGDSDHKRTVRRVRLEDDEVQLEVLGKIAEIRKGNDFTPYKVSKRRTTYILPVDPETSAVIHVDEDVQLIESTDDGDMPYAVGSFVEITVPEQAADKTELVKNMTGITGESFDKPYIAKDAFIQRMHRSIPNVLRLFTSEAETAWLRTNYKPYYYDASRDGMVLGIDPDKLKDLDAHEQSLVQDEIQDICEAIDRTNDGLDLSSRPAGKGSGSTTYERFPGVHAFAKYPSIRAKFSSVMTYRKSWQPGNRRIIFSVVTLADAQQSHGIVLHYAGNHDDYEAWLKRHQ